MDELVLSMKNKGGTRLAEIASLSEEFDFFTMQFYDEIHRVLEDDYKVNKAKTVELG